MVNPFGAKWFSVPLVPFVISLTTSRIVHRDFFKTQVQNTETGIPFRSLLANCTACHTLISPPFYVQWSRGCWSPPKSRAPSGPPSFVIDVSFLWSFFLTYLCWDRLGLAVHKVLVFTSDDVKKVAPFGPTFVLATEHADKYLTTW